MTYSSIELLIEQAATTQQAYATTTRGEREALLLEYAAALKEARDELIRILADDAKKTVGDATAEVDASINIIGKTIDDTRLPDVGGMRRERIGVPVGVVGLITSYNFPMVVAHWNIAPALLAGNAVLWKPSEKTPLVAHACKRLFDKVAGDYEDCLQIIAGNREMGAKMVANERVDMISATGSVGMGEAIKKTLAAKKNNSIPPILELGGNNAVVIGNAMDEGHLSFAVTAILSSFLGTTGQRCTNTRRLIVHEQWKDKLVAELQKQIGEFITSGDITNPENKYGYNQLIDNGAVEQFEQAKAQAVKEGGKLLFGGAGEPAIALMTSHTPLMHEETFAPLLYVVVYDGDISAAMQMVNAPDNAGLVNGIYTLSEDEADAFIRLNEAGHSVINSPRGTGTPANGMGFGGNKASGVGEILWSVDPLAAFTKYTGTRRVAINQDVALS